MMEARLASADGRAVPCAAGPRRAARPVADRAAHFVLVLLGGLVIAGLPVLVGVLSPVVAALFSLFIGALAAFSAPAVAIAGLVCCFCLQNLFVAFVAGSIPDLQHFNTLRGLSFATTCAVWFVGIALLVTGKVEARPTDRRLWILSSLGLALIGVYFLLGAATDLRSAVIYLRNVGTPLLLFQSCLALGARGPWRLDGVLAAIAMIVLGCGLIELVSWDTWSALSGSDDYLAFSMKELVESGTWVRALGETGRVFRGLRDNLQTELFNTPVFGEFGIQVYRVAGPNFHSISYAYGLTFFALLLAARGRVLYVVAALPLLLVIGSKGALATLAFTGIGLASLAFLPSGLVLAGYFGSLALYTVAALIVGSRSGDYHVIGFMGGVNGFLRNPLGRGLGIGGNFSSGFMQTDWSQLQKGATLDGAMESSVGVLLYQMGIAGVALVGVYVALGLALWRRFTATHDRRDACLALAILAVTVNGIFQEEALFSPLAMGLWMALAGLQLARSPTAVSNPIPEPRRAEPA